MKTFDLFLVPSPPAAIDGEALRRKLADSPWLRQDRSDPTQLVYHNVDNSVRFFILLDPTLLESSVEKDPEDDNLDAPVVSTSVLPAQNEIEESSVPLPGEDEPDLVIMGEPPKQKDLQLDSLRLMENPLILVASHHHPLAGLENLHLKDLANERFVVREQGSGTRSAIERFFASNKLALENTLEMSSNEAIKHAVAAGLGLGIISQHTAGLELATDTLVALEAEGFPIMRHWHIVTRRGKRLSPHAEAFREFLLEEAPHYVATNAQLK